MINEKLSKYLAYAKVHPDLFANPSENIYSVLLDPDEIRKVENATARRLEEKGLPQEWAQVGIVYEDQYLFILRDAVCFPDGYLSTYVRIIEEESNVSGVVVLPLYKEKVILIRHFRHATRSWHLEIPRGFGNPEISSEENARQELMEEIGAKTNRLTSLGKMYMNTGISSGWAHLFFADLDSYGKPEVHESISQLLKIDTSEFEDLIRAGEISDSFTLAAYSRAKLNNLL